VQRPVRLWDTLRQRDNNFIEHRLEGIVGRLNRLARGDGKGVIA